MKKRKKSIIALTLATSITMVGCTKTDVKVDNKTQVNEVANVEFVPVVKLEAESESLPSKIKNYKSLDIITKRDSETSTNEIELVSESSKSLAIKNSKELKALLGETVELIPSEYGEGYYYVKGYEPVENSKELKNIIVKLDEGESSTGFLGITFTTSSDELTKSLEMLVDMQDKIELMNENLLDKEDAREVNKFLREEISRYNDEGKDGFVTFDYENLPKMDLKGSDIKINESLMLKIECQHIENKYQTIVSLMSASFLHK